MHNLIIRFKLHKALKILNRYWLNKVDLNYVLNNIDETTLLTLEQYECIDLTKAWGGVIIDINRGSRSQIYLIERSELWFNRIFSYVLGIVSGVLISYIINLLV